MGSDCPCAGTHGLQSRQGEEGLTRELSRPCPTPLLAKGFSATSPGHVHCGDIELDPFEPEHHEEPLAEGAVPQALPVLACLWAQKETSAALSPWHGPSGDSPREYRVKMIEHMPQPRLGSCAAVHGTCYTRQGTSFWPLLAPRASVPHPRAATWHSRCWPWHPLGTSTSRLCQPHSARGTRA